MYCTEWVASNYDIYLEKDIVYKQNSGYEYDASNEEQYKCNEVVRLTKQTAIYMGAANNYVKVTVLPKEHIIKRIAKNVNERDGKRWDKVRISNGKEGYVLSDNLEIIGNNKEYENLNFQYNDKMYDLYFSPMQFGLDIKVEDYPYYFIRVGGGTTDIAIYYTPDAMAIKNIDGGYYNYSISKEYFRITIEKTGEITILYTDNASRRNKNIQ